MVFLPNNQGSTGINKLFENTLKDIFQQYFCHNTRGRLSRWLLHAVA